MASASLDVAKMSQLLPLIDALLNYKTEIKDSNFVNLDQINLFWSEISIGRSYSAV